MLYETLVHSMASNDLSIKQILDLESYFLSKKDLKGCLLIHKNEVLHYFIGSETNVQTIYDFHSSISDFSNTRKLFSGKIDSALCDKWVIVNNQLTEESNSEHAINISELDTIIKESKSPSVGISLFSSIREIILSERLFSFD